MRTLAVNRAHLPSDALQIIAGDFNHTDLKAVHPKLYQHVKCDTRGANRLVQHQIPHQATGLDHYHIWVSQTILFLHMPHAGKQDPIINKTVATWPEVASQHLQDCFDTTN